ncbi:MAG: metal-dependent transcriptional regulator [Salinimicrobium sp.]
MISLAEENYLKTIFHLQKAFPEGVNTNALAEKMESKASSVSEMLKKLSKKKLVEYKKYQGVKLSEKGTAIAVEIIRRHRLWEYFLVEKLNFSWDEVHEVAEQLEHIQSDKLVDELDKYLGFPRKDPHGDPIPDRHGNMTTSEKILLSELSEGQTGICTGVRDSSANFLRYLDKNGISLGKKLSILNFEDFDHSVEVEVDGHSFTLSRESASNIFIKPE